MLTQKRMVLIVAGALTLGTLTASAKEFNFKYNYSFNIFLMGGASTLFDGKDFTSAGHQYHADYARDYKFAVGLGVPIGKILEIQAAYTTGPDNLQITDTSLSPRQLRSYGVESHIGSVGVLGYAPFSRLGFRPYGVAGFDYLRYAPTAAGNTVAATQGFGAVNPATLAADTKVGMNLGFGVEHKLLRNVALRLDIRDHVCSSPNFGLPPRDPTSAIFPVSGYAQNVVYTAGIVFHFAKK